MSNIQKQTKGLKELLESPAYKARIDEVLGKNASTFATSVIQIANSNSMLKNAEPNSIIAAALTAATLNLPLNNALGMAYIVPFKDNKANCIKAQFIIGYKGMKQLAVRSGAFEIINDGEIREGEIKKRDRLKGTIEFDFIEDELERLSKPVVGYFAYIELHTGFSKMLYMTKEEVEAHAKQYSQTYKNGYGLWADAFDAMARKTVVKLLLNSGCAPLSLELQTAIKTDQSVIEKDGSVNYPDNETIDIDLEEVDHEAERIIEFISTVQSLESLEQFEDSLSDVSPEVKQLIDDKKQKLAES